jgi:glycosyltransferase involved in cell wall biosynthesis
MNDTIVSIIVPQFNRKEFLYNNLQSLLNQTFKNSYEILVVNDGGESVQDVIDFFRDDRIRYFEKPNGGLSSARNYGLKQARGKWISTIDQDDGAFDNFLEKMVTFLEDTGHKICYCDSIRMIQKKDTKGEYQIVHRDMPYSIDYNSDLLLVMNLFPCNCLMAAKECFDNVPPYDETVKVYEDFKMNIELSLKYNMVHLPIPLVWHTWREDGSTMSSSRDFTTPIPDIYRKYYKYAKNKVWVAQQQNAVLKQRGLPELFEIK